LSLAVVSTTVNVEPVSGPNLCNRSIDKASSVGLVRGRRGFDFDGRLVVDLKDTFTTTGLGLVPWNEERFDQSMIGCIRLHKLASPGQGTLQVASTVTSAELSRAAEHMH
jgi:hypothetical protein